MELKDYLHVVAARKWVIIQAIVVVTATALAVSLFLMPPSYEGEARVLINERDQGAALLGTVLPELSSQPERGLQTQVQLMQVRPMAENVVRKLGLQMQPEDLLKKVEVSAIGQTNIVSVKAVAGDPKAAAAIANAMADEYVAWSRAAKRESMQSAADEVETRLGEARDQVLALGRRVNEKGKTDELNAELQIATGAYTTLAEKLEQLRINEELELGSGRVVAAAVVVPEPVSPKPLRNGVLGLAVGLVFGLGMAFLYEYLDNTIKSTDEAEKLYGAPVLGHIPTERFEKGQKRSVTLLERPGSPAAEAYRMLRSSLGFVNFEHEIKTVLVASAAPGEGKSTVAANLATSLAQSGQKVVLVSCDFRRPTTEEFFGVPNVVGLSEVLTGSHTLNAALQSSDGSRLRILTSGQMPPNPSELLGSERMHEVVQSLEEWADWVIVDTPPLLAVADGAAVAHWADGVLMVSRAGRSTREDARKATEMLGKVGARLLGMVLWGLEDSGSGAGYGYGFYDVYTRYAGYYRPGTGDENRRTGKRAKKGPLDSGARGVAIGAQGAVAAKPAPEPASEAWVPKKSPGRRVAEFVGVMMAGLLGFMVMLVVSGVVAYVLDRYYGWGLVSTLGSLWQ